MVLTAQGSPPLATGGPPPPASGGNTPASSHVKRHRPPSSQPVSRQLRIKTAATTNCARNAVEIFMVIPSATKAAAHASQEKEAKRFAERSNAVSWRFVITSPLVVGHTLDGTRLSSLVK